MQVTVAEFAQLPGHPQAVQPQRRVAAAGQHQLGGASRPAFHQVGHAPRDRGSRVWKSSTTIAVQAGSLEASLAIDAVTSGDTAPSIASRSAASAPNPGSAPCGASMNPVRTGPGWPTSSHDSQDVTGGGARGPAGQQHALARARRLHDHGQALPGAGHQPVVQHRPGDQCRGQRRQSGIFPARTVRRAQLPHPLLPLVPQQSPRQR